MHAAESEGRSEIPPPLVRRCIIVRAAALGLAGLHERGSRSLRAHRGAFHKCCSELHRARPLISSAGAQTVNIIQFNS